MKSPEFVAGGSHTDARGTLSFVNDFDMTVVKRLYSVYQTDIQVIRAWQGHQREQKWFYVTEGAFQVVLVKVDNWDNPADVLPVYEFELKAGKPGVLHIPGGYANGFRALVPGSKMTIFSDFTIAQSAEDDYRYGAEKWFDWAVEIS